MKEGADGSVCVCVLPSQMQTWLELSLHGVCRRYVGGPTGRSPSPHPPQQPSDW